MQLLFALAVAISWWQYFSSDHPPKWLLFLLFGATLVAFFLVRRYFRATAAANNAVAALATWNRMSDKEQATVHEQAIQILRRSGWHSEREPDFEDDAARFGWYALAMAELGIAPICLIKQWNLVRNPWREALNPPYYFDTAIALAEKQGHGLTMLRPPHLR